MGFNSGFKGLMKCTYVLRKEAGQQNTQLVLFWKINM